MGLIAHYRLDGDATDAVGDHDGVVNGAVQWVKGALGGALDLTGGSKWVTGEGWPITGDFSYSFWAKQIEISSSSLGGLVGNHWHTNGPTGVNVYFRTNLTQITIATADGTSRPSYHVNLVTPVTEWCHYAVTCKGGWVSVYQNGQHLDTRYRVIVQDQSRAWAIGRWTASYDHYYYEGLIDDVRIYDHALSPREVRDLSLGLASHYKFEWDFVDAVRYSEATPVGNVGFSEGVFGHCAVFNSDGKRIDIEPVSTNIATISAWYKRDDVVASSSWRTAFGCSDNIHHMIFNSSNTFGLFDGTFKSSGVVVPEDGKFHHCVIVIPGDGTASFYYDGEFINTVSTTISLSNNPIDRIGDWSGNYWIGYLDDPRIYATALTPVQVKELYQQRASIDSEGNLHVN